MLAGAGFARYLPDNRLLFVRGGLVYSVGFYPQAVAIRGTPDVLLDAIRYDWRNGGSHLAVSTSGVLVYGPGQPSSHELPPCRGSIATAACSAPPTRRGGSAISATQPDGARIAVVVGTSTESDSLGGRRERDAGAAVERAVAVSSGLDPRRARHHRRGEEGREVAAADDSGGRLRRTRRAARERQPVVSGRVVPRRPAAPVPGEQPVDRVGFAQSRGRRRRTSGRDTEGVCGLAVPRVDRGHLDRRAMGGLRIGRARRCGADLRPLVAGRRPQGAGVDRRRAAAGVGAQRRAVPTGRPARTCCGSWPRGRRTGC